MNTTRFTRLSTTVLVAALSFTAPWASGQSSTNAPSSLQRRVLRNLMRVNAPGQPGRAEPVDPLQPPTSPRSASPAKTNETTSAPPPPGISDLAKAIRTMKLDRSSDALFEVVRSQQSGAELSETERFRLAVLLGDWAFVGNTLKSLPVKDGMEAYSRLIESLAANSLSADQYFTRPIPSRNTVTTSRDGTSSSAKQSTNKRGLFLSEDLYAVLDAAPADLTAAQLPSVATLVKVAIGPGGKRDFLSRLERGLKGLGGSTPAGRKLAAQLLSAVGWMSDSARYLPLQREEWDNADTLTLVLTMEYFTQAGVEQRDERLLRRAAELCAFLMQTSRFSSNDRGLFKQATDRFIKLLPALEADAAQQLIRENFLTQPQIMVDLILALGEAGQQAQKGSDLNARLKSLSTQHVLLRVLESKKSALPEAVNVLVMNWLGEAEQTCRFAGAARTGVDPDNPMILYRLPTPSNPRQTVRTLAPEALLDSAPSETIIHRLNRGLAQRVNLTLLKVNLLDPKEPMTLETLQSYLKEHPGQEKELCEDYLDAWVRKRTVVAEDPNVVRMRALGYSIARPPPSGIPLTRLRQNENISQFKSLLTALRALSPEPIEPVKVVQSFMAIHSGAEVYRLEDIEAIFGPPEKMNRAELMNLVTGMRIKLREQWLDPKQQQNAGTNRTEEETKNEVSRGYRTALELVRRGLRPEDADWKEYIVRGQLFFDAAEYEFARQIKLVDYISLRDEAFSSYQKAAEIYAAKIPEMPRGQWTLEPYQMWFFVMLGASDLSQLTRAAARSDPGLRLIGDAMRALPGEAAEGHLKMFGQMLGDLLSQVPANMRQRFLSAGLQVVGEDHPSAQAAVQALNNYKELLNELQLRLTVDGPTRVGHTQPFGVFISLEHTRQLGRESGGFSKYLENLASQRTGYNPYLFAAGQKRINYRDEFSKNIHAALDETFEVASITFHDPSVPTIDLPREGWQETPLAYAVLRAKDSAVDRIPSIQLDMDFADTSGQVVLPVRSQVQPIDAKDAELPPRPCDGLALTFIMDEREWRDGKVVVEISAKADGIIPSHLQMFDFERPGFDVEVTDNGLSVSQFESDSHQKLAHSDRGWQFTYQRKKDLRGDVLFRFPALKPGIKAETVEYKHYQDADLITVDARQALAGVPLSGRVSGTLRNVLIALALLAVGVGAYGFVRLRHRAQSPTTAALAIPAQITPFSVAAFLQRIQREHAPKLDPNAHEALKAQIREIESAFFSSTPSNGAPDLEAVARKWLRVVT